MYKIAQEVGLSEKKLHTGFKEHFGKSAFSMLRNERLEHARQALLSEDILLKQVADRIGYKHVSNFINAFSNHFGYTPGGISK